MSVFSDGGVGGYCKLFLPQPDQTLTDFTAQIARKDRPAVRTYTVRNSRPDLGEIDIDFVDHGDNGPASAWAINATAGSFCGFAGANPLKRASFSADHYLIAADMSALTMAAATIEALPRDAVGSAFFEIETAADKQDIDAPAGLEIHWLVSDNPACPGAKIVAAIEEMDWPTGRVQTCFAGESTMARSLRLYALKEKNLPREDAYISGYWKFGLVEDEHKAFKRSEANGA